jgi:hypothetical protein
MLDDKSALNAACRESQPEAVQVSDERLRDEGGLFMNAFLTKYRNLDCLKKVYPGFDQLGSYGDILAMENEVFYVDTVLDSCKATTLKGKFSPTDLLFGLRHLAQYEKGKNQLSMFIGEGVSVKYDGERDKGGISDFGRLKTCVMLARKILDDISLESPSLAITDVLKYHFLFAGRLIRKDKDELLEHS